MEAKATVKNLVRRKKSWHHQDLFLLRVGFEFFYKISVYDFVLKASLYSSLMIVLILEPLALMSFLRRPEKKKKLNEDEEDEEKDE